MTPKSTRRPAVNETPGQPFDISYITMCNIISQSHGLSAWGFFGPEGLATQVLGALEGKSSVAADDESSGHAGQVSC
jgi:hypothetical protein